MTKKKSQLLILAIIAIGLIIFLTRRNLSQVTSNDTSIEATVIDQETITIDGKKVLRLPSENKKNHIQKLKIANKVSPEWEPNLEKSIRNQGGDSVKDIKIRKVDSFVWNEDGIALFVESVVVTVKNQKDEETSFKALVDAQNGKILKNWDQPIFDPLHPKENFKIKIDPRYHNE